MPRIYVRCPCGWHGQRVAPLGTCPECAAALVDSRDPDRGKRRKWTLSVLERTWQSMTAREAAAILDESADR